MIHPGDVAAEIGRIDANNPKGASVRWELQPLLGSVQRGNVETYRRSALVISREQGMRCGADCTVPVLMSWLGHGHIHVYSGHRGWRCW